MRQYLASVLIGSFVAVMIFGLPALLSGYHHDGCPLLTAQTVLCESTALEHFSLWQIIFAALTIFALAIGMHQSQVGRLYFTRTSHSRRVPKDPPRPTLLQILYARGIHNRKEPMHSSDSLIHSL